MDEDVPIIVLDNGSGIIKAGVAGDDAPSCVMPNIIARSMMKRDGEEISDKSEFFVGKQVSSNCHNMTSSYPMQYGTVVNWEEMEAIWGQVFNHEIHVKSDELPVLCTDSAMSCKAYREKIIQTMFESFSVPKFFLASDGPLISYASGRSLGVYINCGNSVTTIVTMFESTVMPFGFRRVDFGGLDVTKILAKLLLNRGFSFSTPVELEQVRKIKESVCYVALDYELEMKRIENSRYGKVTHTLPSGEVIHLDKERFMAMESIFSPSLFGLSHKGLHELVYESLMACDMDWRQHLMVNFILAGGTTLCPGFKERLEKELKLLCPDTKRVQIIAYPERQYSVWIGGSILGSLSTFQPLLISKAQYEEHGPGIVHSCASCGML